MPRSRRRWHSHRPRSPSRRSSPSSNGAVDSPVCSGRPRTPSAPRCTPRWESAPSTTQTATRSDSESTPLLQQRVGGGTCRYALRDPIDPLRFPRFLTAEARLLSCDPHLSKVGTLQSLRARSRTIEQYERPRRVGTVRQRSSERRLGGKLGGTRPGSRTARDRRREPTDSTTSGHFGRLASGARVPASSCHSSGRELLGCWTDRYNLGTVRSVTYVPTYILRGFSRLHLEWTTNTSG